MFKIKIMSKEILKMILEIFSDMFLYIMVLFYFKIDIMELLLLEFVIWKKIEESDGCFKFSG